MRPSSRLRSTRRHTSRRGPRPTITSADPATTYGSSFSISTPDASSISAVNLVSLGSDTHQSDMSQHFVPLSFTKGNGSLTVQAPSSGTYAPPGYYMVFLVNSSGVPSVASFIHVAAQTTSPAAPTAVTAMAAGDATANISWTAPSNGGSPITSYTVTPYIGLVAQAPTTVSGPNPPNRTTITGLTDGTAYTFTVTAINSIGTGPASAASNAVTPSAFAPPAFVQQVSAHTANVSSVSLTPSSAVTVGNRLIVETGIWSNGSATAKSVTDSGGDTFVELLHYKAADGTEMSVWSAPITGSGGTKPTITVTATGKADIGAAALEYFGLSTVSDATVVDQMAHANGLTGSSPAIVSSGPTPATTGGNELALGFYADSGFGDTLTPAAGFTQRVNVSNVGDMELLVEDAPEAAGSTPAASVTTGARTVWLTGVIVFTAGSGSQATASLAGGLSIVRALRPSGAAARPASARPPSHRTRGHHGTRSHRAAGRTIAACAKVSSAKARRSCVSLHRAAAISKRDRQRFVHDALLKHLSPSLFCHRFAAQTLKGIANLSSGWFAWS